MRDSLAQGVALERTYTVTEDMAPAHLPVKVLSTPSMVQLIEATCLSAAQPHLDENEVTVGTHICVSHTGPARAGEKVTIKCRLKEINKRRLTFDVEVIALQGPISTGTHERAVVDPARMQKKD